MKKLSDKRWACQQSAVNALRNAYGAVLSTLTEVSNGTDGTKAAEASGLLAQVKGIHFIICLVVFDSLLSCSKRLSDSTNPPS